MRTIEDLQQSVEQLKVLHGPRSVQVAKALSLLGIALLNEGDQYDKSIEYLKLASTLSHELGYQIAEEGIDIDYRYATALEHRALTEEQSTEATSMLQRISEARKNYDAANKLVHTAIYAAEDEELDSTMIYFDEAMRSQENGDPASALDLCEKCLMLRTPKFGLESPANIDVLLGYADVLRDVGRFDDAKRVLSDALINAVKGRGRQTVKVAEVLNCQGNLLRIMCEFDQAKTSLLESLSIRKELFGENNIQVAASLNNLAELFREQEEFVLAIQYHESAIKAFENSVGPDHPGTMNAKGNYGISLHRLSKSSALSSELCLNEAIDFMNANGFEGKHPWLVKFSNEHILQDARVAAQTGQYEISMERYNVLIDRKHFIYDAQKGEKIQRALPPLEEQALQKIRQERFEMMTNWCQSLLDRNKISHATELLEKCVKFTEKNFSMDLKNPHEVRMLSTLSMLKSQISFLNGEFPNALELAMKALDISERACEPTDIFKVTPLLFLAEIQCELAKYSEAEGYAAMVIKVLRGKVGKDSNAFGKASNAAVVLLVRSLLLTVRLRLAKGTFEAALAFMDRINELIVNNNLLEHEVNADYLFYLAQLEAVKGSLGKITSSVTEALSIRANCHGKDTLKYLNILKFAAQQYILQGSHQLAMGAIDEANQIIKSIYEDSSVKHPSLSEFLVIKGKVLLYFDRRREAKESIVQGLNELKEMLGTDHPSVIAAQIVLGSYYATVSDFTAARQQLSAAKATAEKIFEGNNTNLYLKLSISFLQCSIDIQQGKISTALLQTLQETRASVESVTEYLNSEGVSLLAAQIMMSTAKVYIMNMDFSHALDIIGKVGTELKFFFREYESPLLYENLLLLAEVNMMKGQYRDAKVQISLAHAKISSIFGPTYSSSHRQILDTYFMATENMRQVGYFYDAMDTLELLDDKISRHYGVTSPEMIRVDFVNALILRDRRKFAKAEEAFIEMEEKLVALYGAQSLQYLEWKIHFGRNFAAQNKNPAAEKLFNEALELAATILDSNSLLIQLIKLDLWFIPKVKPEDQQSAIKALKDQMLPLFSEAFGANHILTLQLKGRLSKLNNQFKKDSGRKMLFDVLKGFDELKPYNLPFDHPLVQELGGYEKVSSKDRLSRNIHELSLYAWATLERSPGDVKILPKTIFVDIDNNDPNIWGCVHFYGSDPFSADATDASQAADSRKGRLASHSKNRDRSPSPVGDRKAAVGSGDLVKEGESLEEALQRESKARIHAEDALSVAKHEKLNLADQLASEQDEVARLNKELAAQKAAGANMQNRVSSLESELSALTAQFKDIQDQLQVRIKREQEEERRRLEEEAYRAAEEKAREERAKNPDAVAPENDPRYRKDLESAAYLFKRAKFMHDNGLYFKAQPFLEEGCVIYERIFGLSKPLTLESIRFMAINLRQMGHLQAATTEFAKVLACESALNGRETEFYAQTLLESLYVLWEEGKVQATLDQLESLAKLLSLKTQNANASVNSLSALYGQCLCLQARAFMEIGKLGESKALIERGQALISRCYGINHSLNVDALIIKALILLKSCKAKEAINQIEQCQMIIKILVKLSNEEADSTTKLAEDGTALVATEMEHPLLATCWNIIARANFVQCAFVEASKKLEMARSIALKYFPVEDSRILEIEFYEADILISATNYAEAKDKYIKVKTHFEEAAKSDGNAVCSHPLLLAVYRSLIDLQMKTGNFNEAKTLTQVALKMLQPYPQSIVRFEVKILEIQMAQLHGKYNDEMKEALEKNLEALQTVVSKEHPTFAAMHLLYGKCLLHANELDNAEKVFSKSLKIIRSVFGEGHSVAVDALLCLVDLRFVGKNFKEISDGINDLRKEVQVLFGPYPEHEMFGLLYFLDGKARLVQLTMQLLDGDLSQSAVEEAKASSPSNDEEKQSPADETDEQSEAKGDDVSVDANGEVHAKVTLPVFNNQKFKQVEVFFDEAFTRYQNVFKTPIRLSAEKFSEKTVGSPLIAYMQGLVGAVKLMEFVALQDYIRTLNSSQRELYYNQLAAEQSKGRKLPPGKAAVAIVDMRLPEPPGKMIIEQSIKLLEEGWALSRSHAYPSELNESLRSLQLQFDDMEIAHHQCKRAKQLIRIGRFADADKLLDEAFGLFFRCIGPIQSLQSLIIAEVLFDKAENARRLGKKIDLVMNLHLLSVRIYRMHHGNITDLFVIKNLIGITYLLLDQKLYDDALTMYQQLEETFEDTFKSVSGENPDDHEKLITHVQIKTLIARCMLEIYRFEDAERVDNEALDLLKTLSKPGVGATTLISAEDQSAQNGVLAECLIRIYLNEMQIFDYLGKFDTNDHFYTQIETILQSWEQNETPETMALGEFNTIKAEVLQVRAQHFMLLHRFPQAQELLSQSLEIKFSLFNLYKVPDPVGAAKKKTAFEMEWSKEKTAEVRDNFLLAMETLLNNNTSQSSQKAGEGQSKGKEEAVPNKDTTASKKKKKDEDGPLEEEIRSTNQDIATDFMSHGSSGGAESKGGEEEVVSVLDLLLASGEDRLFNCGGGKTTAHIVIAELLFLQARLNISMGNVQTAKELLDSSQQMVNFLFPRQSLFKLSISFYIAELRFLQNQLEESKQMHMKTLEQRLSIVTHRAESCIEISESYAALSRLYVTLNQFDDAMQYVNDAMKVERRCFPGKKDNHYRIQVLLVTCAEILHSKGFFSDSNILCGQVIGSLKHLVGDLHASIADIYVIKGRNEMELSQLDEAQSSIVQAKAISQVLFGDNHYKVGLLHYYNSQNLRLMGKLLEAKQTLDLAVQAIRAQLGKYHFYTIFTLLEIGFNFLDMGKYVTCQHVINRAVHLLKKSVGKDHMTLALANYALGELHVKIGLLEPVTEFFNQALYIVRKVVGTDRHPLVAIITASSSEIKAIKGEYDTASQGFDDALALMKLVFNTTSHYHISKATLMLANIFFQQGKFKEAKSYFDRASAMFKQIYSKDHPLFYDSQFGIAQCLLATGKIEQSKALFERCLVGYKDWKGSSHPIVGSVLNKIGDVLNILNRFSAAESILAEAWVIRTKSFKECNENHPEIAENLISLSITQRHRGLLEYSESQVAPAKPKEVIAKGESRPSSAIGADEKKQIAPESEIPDEEELGSKGSSMVSQSNQSKLSGAGTAQLGMETVDDQAMALSNPAELTASQSKQLLEIMEDDDEESAPTVAISMIEKLDNETQPPEDDGSLPPNAAANARALFEDAKNYKTVPLLERAMNHLMVYLGNDISHPLVLQVKFLIAETLRAMGRYDECLEMHEELFQFRRKVIGDNHIDTVASLVAIGEVQRCMKRVFSAHPGRFQPNLAPDPSGLGPRVLGSVSLVDHLQSLLQPVVPPRVAQRSVDNSRLTSEEEEEEEKALKLYKEKIPDSKWVFLTKKDEASKKPKPLPLPKGYMGYAFPPVKKERQEVSEALKGGGNSGGGGAAGNTDTNPLHDAKKCLEMALALQRKLFASEDPNLKRNEYYDHPLTATCLFNKAEIFRLRGDGMAALKFLEQCLAMRRRLFRTHHPLIAECLVSMAEILRSDQRYSQALPIYDKALEIRAAAFGEDHPSIAEIHNSVALLQISQGNFSRAQELLAVSMKICNNMLDKAHPATGLVINNHAVLLQSTGQLREALNGYKQALEIKIKVFGEFHPETAATFNNIGLVFKSQGKLEDAAKYFLRALEIQKKVLGSNHPDVGSTKNNLATVYCSLDGHKFEAKELFRDSLAIRTAAYGSENILVASTMNNYAVLLYSLGEIGPAKDLFEGCLTIRRKLLGDDHPAVAETLHNTGYWYYAQGYLPEAKHYYEDALKIRSKVFGEMHLLVATTALHMSGVLDQLGSLDEALKHAQKAYSTRVELLGELHAETEVAKRSLEYIQQRVQGTAAADPAQVHQILNGSSASKSKVPGTAPRLEAGGVRAAKGKTGPKLDQQSKSLEIGENRMD